MFFCNTKNEANEVALSSSISNDCQVLASFRTLSPSHLPSSSLFTFSAPLLLTCVLQVLHGDIAQAQRDVTLASFREGRFHILVCTDVAARGLDIEVHYHAPLLPLPFPS